jgi:O6-methylguanine-DNA--protein-cysteine methyltransferase
VRAVVAAQAGSAGGEQFSGTPFQERVWAARRTIAAGTTLSCGALARSAEWADPGAALAERGRSARTAWRLRCE